MPPLRTGKDVENFPKELRLFRALGVELRITPGDSQAKAQCPFCKEEKFHVGIETGKWDCKAGRCGASGNPSSFLKRLWDESDKETPNEAYNTLAKDRKLLDSMTLHYWGAAQSIITGEWIVPGYNLDGKLCQLYRYKRQPDGKLALIPTPPNGHYLHGINLHDPTKDTIFVCEGFWDGCTLWEALRRCADGESSSRLEFTADEARSLLLNASVIAVPGCNAFKEQWVPLFSEKRVILPFDSDHPKPHSRTGQLLTPAGYHGVQRVTQLLAGHEKPPASISFLRWGPEGFAPDKPDRWDIRDELSQGKTWEQRVSIVAQLLQQVEKVSDEWVEEGQKRKTSGDALRLLKCESYRDAVNAMRKVIKWTPKIDKTFACMAACLLSTSLTGDQIWLRVIGPPSCGKSTFCEALSSNRKWIVAKSNIRGFHSGTKNTKTGKEFALIEKLKNKTLVTKDGDTLLQSPNKDLILSEARDIYDSVSRVHYRHGIDKDYEGYRMTWILCGTSALRQLDSSELGERFLTVCMMDGIDEALEDEILWRVVNKADRSTNHETNGEAESRYDPETVFSHQMVGGYVHYLRENAGTLLKSVTMDDQAKRRCIDMGKFVAYLRARPSKKQDERTERELASRLVSQMTRLAKCLAAVFGKKDVDEQVMHLVAEVAMDSANGRTLNIAKHLYESGEKGVTLYALSILTGETEEKDRSLLYFLRRIGAVEVFQQRTPGRTSIRKRWRLSPKMVNLYRNVMTMLKK